MLILNDIFSKFKDHFKTKKLQKTMGIKFLRAISFDES
jgi:hypothetical protein